MQFFIIKIVLNFIYTIFYIYKIFNILVIIKTFLIRINMHIYM